MVSPSAWCDDPEGKAPKRVLVLFSYNYNFPSQQHIVAGIESGRKTSGINAGDFVYEYLDLAPKSLDQRMFFHDLLQKKYKGQTFDLIITIYDPALEFLLNEGGDFFSETPCLAIFTKERKRLMRAGHEVHQIPLYYDIKGTFQLSLILFPNTRNVLFVVGSDPNDRVFEDQARRDFAPWQKKIKVDYTVDQSVPDMVRTVSMLKPGTLVIYSRVTADATGRRYVPGDVGAMLAESSPVPVFCLVSSHIDRGMIGGSLIDYESLGAMLTRIMVTLTEGKPLSAESSSAYIKPMFDWKQLRRFNAGTNFLPPETVYINRPLTLWSQYKTAVIGTLVVVFALASMVVALIIQNRNTILAAEIEERRQVQAVIQAANAYNRGLIEASLDPLVTIGPDGKITDANFATEMATGCERKDLVGKDFADFFTEPDKAGEVYQLVFKQGDVRDFPLSIRHKDGSVMPVLYNAAVYRGSDGGVIGAFAAARDITRLKKAEEELREANAYNRSLIDGTIDPLATVSPDGKILDVNPASERATGYQRDELIGRDFADFFTEPEKARAGYQQVFKEGHVQDYALYFRRRDGSTIPVLYNASVYRDRNGNVAGALAAARDITRLKQAEEAQLSLERKLLEAKKSESLGRMAGAIAHLYNNLLAVVIGNLELFVNDIPPEKDRKSVV
jgi:PAS domain S-box-containing protein